MFRVNEKWHWCMYRKLHGIFIHNRFHATRVRDCAVIINTRTPHIHWFKVYGQGTARMRNKEMSEWWAWGEIGLQTKTQGPHFTRTMISMANRALRKLASNRSPLWNGAQKFSVVDRKGLVHSTYRPTVLSTVILEVCWCIMRWVSWKSGTIFSKFGVSEALLILKDVNVLY